MSLVQVLLAAEAAAQQRAVARTAYRHRHLAPAPLVVSVFNLSGEACAPLGFCFGTDRKKPTVLIAAEPRNRACRFETINAFSRALVEHLQPYLSLVNVGEETPFFMTSDTPQLMVPNRATRDFLGNRLGRSLRYLGLSKTHPVPPETPLAGAHLSFLADHAAYPGQSLFTAATELLSNLFVTGQSDFENENLASLLAWIRNPAGSGLTAIRGVEQEAYGPVPDPAWEISIEPHVREWSVAARAQDANAQKRAERAVAEVLTPHLLESWQATFEALDLARAVPTAPSVATRWEKTDHAEWSNHARRFGNGSARFARRHGALYAARRLETWSRALEKLSFCEATEDPLLMAELDAEGRCLSGKVVAVKPENRELRPGNKRQTQVPLIELRLSGAHRLVIGDELRWLGDTRVRAEVRKVSADRAQLAVISGHDRGQRLPTTNSQTQFAAIDVYEGKELPQPKEVPWTHRGEAGTPGPDEAVDIPVTELAALPLVGAVPESEIPGVVQ